MFINIHNEIITLCTFRVTNEIPINSLIKCMKVLESLIMRGCIPGSNKMKIPLYDPGRLSRPVRHLWWGSSPHQGSPNATETNLLFLINKILQTFTATRGRNNNRSNLRYITLTARRPGDFRNQTRSRQFVYINNSFPVCK